MKVRKLSLAIVAILFWLGASAAIAQTVVTVEEASKTLKLENLNATPDRVTGVVVNESPHQVRDINILVQYHWLWNNEFHPGQNSPGELATVHLDKTLAPGASLPFSYTPRLSANERHDGRFMPEVDIGGFTVIVPQSQSAQR